MAIREEFLELLRKDLAFREEVRRQLLTEELLALPGLIRELVEAQRRTGEPIERLTEQMQALADAQVRTDMRVGRLEDRIDRLEGALNQLAEQLRMLTQEVRALVSWQKGEAGRRDGERYELEIVRRAPVLFNGGQGGPPDQPWIQKRLTEQLGVLLSEGILPIRRTPFWPISSGGRGKRLL